MRLSSFLIFVIPTERVLCATEESAVDLGKGTASAVPNRAFSPIRNDKDRQSYEIDLHI